MSDHARPPYPRPNHAALVRGQAPLDLVRPNAPSIGASPFGGASRAPETPEALEAAWAEVAYAGELYRQGEVWVGWLSHADGTRFDIRARVATREDSRSYLTLRGHFHVPVASGTALDARVTPGLDPGAGHDESALDDALSHLLVPDACHLSPDK